eukprot:1159443-Pelagomonas_calceolata.AAC.2
MARFENENRERGYPAVYGSCPPLLAELQSCHNTGLPCAHEIKTSRLMVLLLLLLLCLCCGGWDEASYPSSSLQQHLKQAFLRVMLLILLCCSVLCRPGRSQRPYGLLAAPVLLSVCAAAAHVALKPPDGLPRDFKVRLHAWFTSKLCHPTSNSITNFAWLCLWSSYHDYAIVLYA